MLTLTGVSCRAQPAFGPFKKIPDWTLLNGYWYFGHKPKPTTQVFSTPHFNAKIMRPIISPLIMLLSAWLFSCSTHATGIYKWVDARGNVHFGDKPSAETVEEIDIKAQSSGTPPPNEAERRARQRRLLNVYQEEREAARAKAQKKKQHKARALKNCNLARDRLRNLRRAAYLYNLDKQGNRVILSDQKREKAISDTQAAVNRWCK